MSGRNIFKRLRYLISISVFIMKIVPTPLRRFIWSLTAPFCGYFAIFIRYILLKSSAKKCGDNVYVGTNCIIKNMDNIEIGDNVSIHDNCYMDASGGITIDRDVSIAHGSSLVSFNHTWSDINQPIKYNKVSFMNIHICQDVWIGCGVRIMAGVKIDARCVVAAGAVVTKNFLSNSLIGGVPARTIKKLDSV